MKSVKYVVFAIILFLLILAHINYAQESDSEDDADTGSDDDETSDGEVDDSDSDSDSGLNSETVTTTSTEKPKITESTPTLSTISLSTTTVKPKFLSKLPEITNRSIGEKIERTTTNLSKVDKKDVNDNKEILKSAITTSTPISIAIKPPNITDKHILDEEDYDESDYKNEKKEKENKSEERDPNDNSEDSDDDYDNEDNDNDYFEELTRDELVRNLLQSYTAATNGSVNKNASINERWISLLTAFDNEIQSLVRAITPLAMDVFYELNLSPHCVNSMLRFATGLQQQQEWAFSLMDSNGHLPIGLFSGTLSSLGAYDQCMETLVVNDDNTEAFRGQYCLLQLRPPLPSISGRLSYRKPYISLNGSKFEGSWLDRKIAGRYAVGFYSVSIYNALCVPSSCSPQELNTVLDRYVGDYFDVGVEYCHHKIDGFSLNYSQIIALTIVLVSSALAIIASFIELCCPNYINAHLFGRIVGCFSIISNARKLFHVDSHKSNSDLQFAHGFRVLTMIWIILIHTFTVGTLFVPMLVYRFEEEARKFGKQLSTQFIFNGYISVSNFFFLSGLVIAYITLPLMARHRGPSFIKYVSIRWLRFIPPLIGTICFHLLWPLFGSGPVFEKISEELTKPCLKNWWTNILLVNNWLLLPDMCMVHTWFLSADFQLHIISYLILYTLSRKQGVGLALIAIMIGTGVALPAYLVYSTDAPPIPMPFNEPKLDQFYHDLSVQYHPTYNHLSTYFVGILVGFFLTKRKTGPQLTTLSLPLQLVCWSLLPIVSLIAVFATYLWTGLDLDYGRLTAAAYSGFHRLAYILFFAWIAIYCATTKSGFVSRLLSAPFFIPLSRLSYSVYLVHILVVWYFVLQTRHLIRFSYANFLYATGGVTLFSLFLALLLYLLFESVWTNIVNLAFKSKQQLNTIDSNNNKDLRREQSMSQNVTDLSVNRHFLNAAFVPERGDKWFARNESNAKFNEGITSSAISANIYVEVGEPVGHKHQCLPDCYQCTKNTHL